MASLEESAREMKRQYLKDWRQKHKDKVKEYNAKYWKRKAVKQAEEGNDEPKDNQR